MNTLSNGVVSLVSGVLFGAGMIVSGMADPSVVLAFLDVTGDWDPSLIFVMGGALAVFAPVYHIVIKKRKKAVNGTEYNWPKSPKVDRKLVTGSIIFGIGWGIAGICPGPAVSSLSGGSTIIITFVLCMLAGMAMANIYTRKQR
ncbi:YeeE/YedE family protein [uncultured Vibrio sp.]|uniref:YeeE/YedE family protein n=1 Tax=uncultured Vibrio sp. TaxID=114054 RepID=UPI0025DD486C|nr:YeeE/YedE family protein [uncultured Vibrio sp.]